VNLWFIYVIRRILILILIKIGWNIITILTGRKRMCIMNDDSKILFYFSWEIFPDGRKMIRSYLLTKEEKK
jgi:hypothetical protein